VRVVAKENHKNMLTAGKAYEAKVSDDGDGFWVTCDDGCLTYFNKRRFIVEQENTQVKRHNTHMNWDSYEFNIRSEDQISEETIQKDLSWTNPMMILEFADDPEYVKVYIDDSIWNKASACGETYECEDYGIAYTAHRYVDRLDQFIITRGMGYGYVSRKQLSELIALVKEIKRADWNESRVTTCTVRKIKI
jgi:hypothetical protein